MTKIPLLIAVFLCGCAADRALPPLGNDDPANPDAPIAPLTWPTTLATTAPATKPATATTTAGLYACPMHPDVTSSDPNARCRICGMRLVPRKGGGR